MDVGCGTGILSIFCAQVGAKRVRCSGVDICQIYLYDINSIILIYEHYL